MEKATAVRYFDAQAGKQTPIRSKNAHSEFLRTGHISRYEERWLPPQKRYYDPGDVAAITGRKLEAAGEATHERLNAFHPSIRFPRMVFHRTIETLPHLGYCNVTASHTSFDAVSHVAWSFYVANFFAELGGEAHFFEKIDASYSRMYFAVATDIADGETVAIDRAVHRDGLLFRTADPKAALKNVLMLGASSQDMRAIIKAI